MAEEAPEVAPMMNGHHSSLSSDSPLSSSPSPSPPPSPVQRSRERSRLVGTVKWFNAKNGYGFVTRNDNGEDVFVHFSGISRKNPHHTLKSLGDGETVEFNIIATNVTGPAGRPVRGNPYVSHIPLRRYDSFASGDPIPLHVHRHNYYDDRSRIPRWIPNWQG